MTASAHPPRAAAVRPLLWLRHLVTGALLSVLACSASDEPTELACEEGKADCGGECADLTRGLQHCGACSKSCGPGQDCVAGACSCMSDQTACTSGCVELKEDAKNCGACDRACGTGLFCSSGACVSACAPGQTACGSSCVDFQTSMNHCGTCNSACEAGSTCLAGSCQCSQGRLRCGTACVDSADDPLNCGACGTVCATGEACLSGVCKFVSGSGGVSGVGGSLGAGGSAGSSGVGNGAGGSSSGAGPASGGSAGANGGVGGSGTAGGVCAKTGFYVENKKLYDKNCKEFIMRGVNYPYAWYSTRNTQQDFAAIAATGANTVRIVLSNGQRWTQTPANAVTQLITWAKAQKLVAIVEVHDMTGWSEQSGSVPLNGATSYWTGSGVANALKGQEAFVLINVANEPMGNNTTAEWASRHVTAVQAIRGAGLRHALIVDAPNWGQDWSNTMRGGAGLPIWEADSDKNLVFSVHMYDVYGSAQTVSSYMNTFLSRNSAPLVVGEFAADHGASGNVDEATIMSFADSLGIGYLGWSWAGNGSDLASLDITNDFNASSLTTWGARLINGENGIKQSSKLCTCFN